MDGLELRVELPDTVSAGEFLVATLDITNRAGAPLPVTGWRHLDGGDLWIKLCPPDNARPRVLGRFGFEGCTRQVLLHPGECLRFGVNLSIPDYGTAFDRPGHYRLKALYDAGAGPVESNVCSLTVVPEWLEGAGRRRFTDAAAVGHALARLDEGLSTADTRFLEGYRDSVGTGTLLCQLALLAVSLHRAGTSGSVRVRSSFILEHAIERFGAIDIAVLITALFPRPGGVRSALCAAFERGLAHAPGAEAARAIVRGEPFDAAAARFAGRPSSVTTRH